MLFRSARATMINLQGATMGRTINQVIILVGLVAVLSYFIFSIPQNGPVKRVSQAGRWIMMITFGVSFGNVVAGRLNLLLGQLANLLSKWLGLY